MRTCKVDQKYFDPRICGSDSGIIITLSSKTVDVVCTRNYACNGTK